MKYRCPKCAGPVVRVEDGKKYDCDHPLDGPGGSGTQRCCDHPGDCHPPFRAIPDTLKGIKRQADIDAVIDNGRYEWLNKIDSLEQAIRRSFIACAVCGRQGIEVLRQDGKFAPALAKLSEKQGKRQAFKQAAEALDQRREKIASRSSGRRDGGRDEMVTLLQQEAAKLRKLAEDT